MTQCDFCKKEKSFSSTIVICANGNTSPHIAICPDCRKKKKVNTIYEKIGNKIQQNVLWQN